MPSNLLWTLQSADHDLRGRARRAVCMALALASGCGDAGITPDGSTGSTGTGGGADSDSGTSPPGGDSSASSGRADGEPTSGGPTSGDTSSTGEDPSTGGDTGQPAVCNSGPPTTLRWVRSGAELPGPVGPVASTGTADTVVTGTVAESGDTDVFVALLDPAGATLWMDVYGGAKGLDDGPMDVAVDAAGFIHVLVIERVFQVQGDDFATTDGRLVILRYAPDGAHVWRWERAREPVVPGAEYAPGGVLGLTGATISLLEYAYGEPNVVITLDAAGQVLGETTLADVASLSVARRALGPGGEVYMAGNLDDNNGHHPLWIGGFAPDGAVAWFDTFGGLGDQARALVAGRQGELYVARSTSKPTGAEYHLQRYDATGGSAWTLPLPVVGNDGAVRTAGLRCDGSPLLAGGIDRPAGPELLWDNRVDLWAGGYATDGAPAWTFEHEFGPPASHGNAGRIAGVADGDVIVSASHLDGEGSVPWLARLTPG